jgi:hypothetical protein
MNLDAMRLKDETRALGPEILSLWGSQTPPQPKGPETKLGNPQGRLWGMRRALHMHY